MCVCVCQGPWVMANNQIDGIYLIITAIRLFVEHKYTGHNLQFILLFSHNSCLFFLFYFFPLQALYRQFSTKMLYRICYKDKFWLTRYLTHNGENRTNETTLVVCTPTFSFFINFESRWLRFTAYETRNRLSIGGEKKNTNKCFTCFFCTNTSFFNCQFFEPWKIKRKLHFY